MNTDSGLWKDKTIGRQTDFSEDLPWSHCEKIGIGQKIIYLKCIQWFKKKMWWWSMACSWLLGFGEVWSLKHKCNGMEKSRCDLPFQGEAELPWRSPPTRQPVQKRLNSKRIPPLQKLRWWDQDVLVVHICGEKVGERRGCGKNEQADVGIQIRVWPGGNTYCTRRQFNSLRAVLQPASYLRFPLLVCQFYHEAVHIQA